MPANDLYFLVTTGPKVSYDSGPLEVIKTTQNPTAEGTESVKTLLLEYLPVEIVNLILVNCFDLSHGRDRSRLPTVILSLSRRFRDISLALPRLWSYLLISHDSKLEGLRLTVQRSRNERLDVEIPSSPTLCPSVTLEEIYPLLLPCVHRISSLIIRDPMIEDRNPFENFIQSSHWPNLRTLRITRSMQDYPQIELQFPSDHFPCIEQLEIHATHIHWHVPFPKSLSKLNLTGWGNASNLDWACFGEFQHLEELEIDNPYLFIFSDTLDLAYIEHGPACILLSLKKFVITNVDWKDMCMLLCFIHAPALQSLSIHLMPYDTRWMKWNPQFSGTVWGQVSYPELRSLRLNNTAVLQDDLVVFLSNMPRSLHHLLIHRDTGRLVPTRHQTITQLLHPELAQLRGQLEKLEFFGVDAVDIALLVRDGSCASLKSIYMDVESSNPEWDSTIEEAENHAAAVNIIRGLVGVDVTLCMPGLNVGSEEEGDWDEALHESDRRWYLAGETSE